MVYVFLKFLGQAKLAASNPQTYPKEMTASRTNFQEKEAGRINLQEMAASRTNSQEIAAGRTNSLEIVTSRTNSNEIMASRTINQDMAATQFNSRSDNQEQLLVDNAASINKSREPHTNVSTYNLRDLDPSHGRSGSLCSKFFKKKMRDMHK